MKTRKEHVLELARLMADGDQQGIDRFRNCLVIKGLCGFGRASRDRAWRKLRQEASAIPQGEEVGS